MNTIRIIGLGTKGLDELSVKTNRLLQSGDPIFLRTARHPAAEEMSKNGIDFTSYDNLFEENDDFDEIYTKIVEKIVAHAKKCGTINYCIPGSPYLGDNVTKMLLNNFNDEFNLEIIDAESFLDKCLKLSGYADYKNIVVHDANEIDEFSFDRNALNIITQIDSHDLASDIKIKLMEAYPDDTMMLIVDVISEKVDKIPLYMCDNDNKFGFSTYFCVLPIEISENALYNINNLLRIVRKLRGPHGCPWDMKQTPKSCMDDIIEEAHEVVEAIKKDDIDNLSEELGDLLLQVVFQSEMASEEGYFNIYDVYQKICEKLIRRHPHVFGDDVANSLEEALELWNKAKIEEKSN